MVVGAILGPMAEEQVRKAMAISPGLIQGVPSMVISGAMAVLLVVALWLKRHRRISEERLPDIDTTAIRQVEDDIEQETRR